MASRLPTDVGVRTSLFRTHRGYRIHKFHTFPELPSPVPLYSACLEKYLPRVR